MDRDFRKILVLLLFWVSLALQTKAAQSSYALYLSTDNGRSWAETGLRSETRINALTSTGNTIIAGTDAGILISTNEARSWRSAGTDHGSRLRVTSVAIMKKSVFAGTSDGVLLVSADGGANWQVNSSFPRRSIRSLHVMKQTLHVGTDADQVYRSSDGGETWSHLSAGLPSLAQVFSLASISNRLFAGLYSRGLYSWSEANQKWLRLGASAGIRPLALAATGRTLIAGHNPGGICWSDDLGKSWRRWSHAKAPAAPGVVEPLPSLESILNPAAPSTLDAPIWEMAADESIALAGAGSGFVYSTDGARSWSRASTGLPGASSGIAFHIRPGLILAAVSEKPVRCAESQRE